MMATRWAILLGALAFAAGAAAAEAPAPEAHDAAPPPAACQVPDSLLASDGKLPAVRAELAAHRPVRVVVLGTASSMGAGVSAPQKAYPERLQAVLNRRLPVKVSVLNKSKLHDTAAEMLHRFQNEIIPERPDLVIWQTGTTDAVRQVETKEFDDSLSQGIEMLAEKHIDVILMDPQYSPHTTTLINFQPYLQDMELIAQSHDVMLFSRNAVMEHWAEEGDFGPDEGSKPEQLHHADMIHDCIAELLGWMIEVASTPGDLPATATAH